MLVIMCCCRIFAFRLIIYISSRCEMNFGFRILFKFNKPTVLWKSIVVFFTNTRQNVIYNFTVICYLTKINYF